MKRLTVIFLSVCLLPAIANAQPVQEYAPPDKDLWEIMVREIGNVPMAFAAHQSVQQLLQNVQREALLRQARAKAPTPKPDTPK